MRSKLDKQERKPDKGTRPGGRAAEVVTAVHIATIALLEEQGYQRLEIPTIAERAGVNKTSIYRRWPSKAELVVDVALTRLHTEVPLPDTGTLKGDLTALLRAIAAAIATPFGGGLLRAFISLENESGIAELRERFWNERYAVSGELLQRAIVRGELPGETDTLLMMTMAVAPLFFRALVIGSAITDVEIQTIVERLVMAYRVP